MKDRPSIGMLLAEHAKGYHAQGVIRRGRQLVAHYFVCDEISDDALAAIREHYPEAERMMRAYEFAPEIACPALVLPTGAEMQRQREAAEKESDAGPVATE